MRKLNFNEGVHGMWSCCCCGWVSFECMKQACWYIIFILCNQSCKHNASSIRHVVFDNSLWYLRTLSHFHANVMPYWPSSSSHTSLLSPRSFHCFIYRSDKTQTRFHCFSQCKKKKKRAVNSGDFLIYKYGFLRKLQHHIGPTVVYSHSSKTFRALSSVFSLSAKKWACCII